MNSLKLITISCFVILSFSLLIILTQVLTKNFKSKINNDGRLKLSFGIWYSAIFLSGAIIISITTNIMFEVIDNLIKIQPQKLYLALIKTSSIILGGGLIWLVLWVFIIKIITNLVPLKTSENVEMEDDNIGYFIIKATLLLAVVFSLSPVITLILKSFIPNTPLPFYH